MKICILLGGKKKSFKEWQVYNKKAVLDNLGHCKSTTHIQVNVRLEMLENFQKTQWQLIYKYTIYNECIDTEWLL